MDHKQQTNSEINQNASTQKLFISSKIKKIKNWTQDEDDILLRVANDYGYKNWKAIAQHLDGRNAIQCSARYKRIRPGIVKGSWTEEEDQVLLDLIKKFGKNWSLISKYMPSRSGKQIRDRFLNSLDPTINKDKFTEDEDKKIVNLYAKYGTAWSVIARSFKGRTGDMIKNRFYSSLKRKIHVNEPKRIRKNKKLKNKELIRNNQKHVLSTNANNSQRINQFNSNNYNNTSTLVRDNNSHHVTHGINNNKNVMRDSNNKIIQNNSQSLNKQQINVNDLTKLAENNLTVDDKMNILLSNLIDNTSTDQNNQKDALEKQLNILLNMLYCTYSKLDTCDSDPTNSKQQIKADTQQLNNGMFMPDIASMPNFQAYVSLTNPNLLNYNNLLQLYRKGSQN